MEEESAGDPVSACKRQKQNHEFKPNISKQIEDDGNAINCSEVNSAAPVSVTDSAAAPEEVALKANTMENVAPIDANDENDCDSQSTPTLSSKDNSSDQSNSNSNNNDSGMCSKASGEAASPVVDTTTNANAAQSMSVSNEQDSGFDVQMDVAGAAAVSNKNSEEDAVVRENENANENEDEDRDTLCDCFEPDERSDSQIVNVNSDTNSSFAVSDIMNPNVIADVDENTFSSSDQNSPSLAHDEDISEIIQFRQRTYSSRRNYREINIEISLPPSSHHSQTSDVSMDDGSAASSPISSIQFQHNTDSNTDDDVVEDEATNDTASNQETANVAESRAKDTVEEIMSKEKPAYTWNSTYELMWREHGLAANRRCSLRNGSSLGFNARYYASRHVVERMKLSHQLRKHNGCVNCLNFNRSGNFLCSGSDDCRIIIWDWANKKTKKVFKSGHTENIFQTKFIDNGGTFLTIISASRDGQVRRSVIPSSGTVHTERLYSHMGGVHKLVLVPQSTQEIISVGEDGMVMHYDMRTGRDPNRLTKATIGNKERKMRLYSISHHPHAPEYCVCGFYEKVRVYDKRNSAKPVSEMYPKDLPDNVAMPQVTCAVYNNSGTEILASYSDDHIYLFDNTAYVAGQFKHQYKGHINHRTIKGVNFFGPNSEYVVSGSDCGHIFFWDKNTEAIINYMHGDRMGVVNCLEPHPWIPVMATSGLDNNIKIWTPNSETYPPDLSQLERHVHRNQRRVVNDDQADFDDRQFHYFMRQFLRSRGVGARNGATNNREDSSSDDDETNMFLWTSTDNSNSSSNNDDEPALDSLRCRTQ